MISNRHDEDDQGGRPANAGKAGKHDALIKFKYKSTTTYKKLDILYGKTKQISYKVIGKNSVSCLEFVPNTLRLESGKPSQINIYKY